MDKPSRKGKPYADGELEIILSLVPTRENIARLSELLGRSEDAIHIVYKIAYEKGPFGHDAEVQREKIFSAKARLGIAVGGTGTR